MCKEITKINGFNCYSIVEMNTTCEKPHVSLFEMLKMKNNAINSFTACCAFKKSLGS